MAAWWRRRRVLSDGLPELFRQYDLARADRRSSASTASLLPGLLLRAAPGLRTLMLCCGQFGVEVVRGRR